MEFDRPKSEKYGLKTNPPRVNRKLRFDPVKPDWMTQPEWDNEMEIMMKVVAIGDGYFKQTERKKKESPGTTMLQKNIYEIMHATYPFETNFEEMRKIELASLSDVEIEDLTLEFNAIPYDHRKLIYLAINRIYRVPAKYRTIPVDERYIVALYNSKHRSELASGLYCDNWDNVCYHIQMIVKYFEARKLFVF